MSETEELKQRLTKRLTPLYLSAFFQSFVLWYTIEKLFMRNIGFNNTGIGFMIALYSAVMLIVETPSGILADRWSRKGVLMLASIFLSLSALTGGFSYGIGGYLVSAAMWGIFFACYSGMYDSIIYDTLAEETSKSSLFDYFYGRVQLFDGVGLALSSLAGAWIASSFGLRMPYYLTVPLALVPLLVLMKFKEPTLHKQAVVIPLNKQLRDTFQAITRNRSALPIVAVLIVRSILAYCIFEFSQLWLLQLHTQTAYYGLANAAVLSSIGIGGLLVTRLKLSRYLRMILTLVLLLASAVGLILFRTTAPVVAAQFIFATSLISIYIVFSRLLHDKLSPAVRAGAASAASTLGRFAIIPTALLIGYVSQHYTIYKAAYVLLVLSIIMALFIQVVAKNNGRKGLESI